MLVCVPRVGTTGAFDEVLRIVSAGDQNEQPGVGCRWLELNCGENAGFQIRGFCGAMNDGVLTE